MNGKIVANQDVLLPEHIPDKLLFRETEYQALVLNVKNGISTLILGPVGSGKTALVKILQKELGKEKLPYVDCMVHDTGFAVLKEIIPTVKAAFLRSTFELVEELRRLSRDVKKVICFDNFVRLKDVDIIDKVMALGLIVILVSSIDRDLHRLGPNSTAKITGLIRLRNYSMREAYKILRARADHGLAKGSCDDNVLKSIVGSTDGNITLGLNVLRAAALKVEAQGRSEIGVEDLETLLPKHREDLDLTEDERVIMAILREKVSVEHRQLYSLYCQSARAPKQERTFRNYMQRLVAKFLVVIDFSNGQRVYRVVEHD